MAELTEILNEDEVFLSHDVVSLVTNTHMPAALAVIRSRLEQDNSLENEPSSM